MSEDKVFQLEEYKSLRKEVELYIAESRLQERYTVAAVGIIWGWLIANRKTHWLMWALPILLTSASAIRFYAINLHFGNLKQYLEKLETSFGVVGWQHQKKGRNLGVMNVVLSGALLLLAVVAFFMRCELATKFVDK